MNYLKKISSMVLSVALVLTCVVTPAVSVNAAGVNTVLHTLFTEMVDPVTPEQLVYDSAREANLDASGMIASNWKYFSAISGTQYGFPALQKNVHRAYFNFKAGNGYTEDEAARAYLPGREVVSYGMRFFTHAGGWGAFVNSISSYTNTASLTLKISIGKESYLKDSYVYMKSLKNGVHSFTAIKLEDKYYTSSDIGKPVTLSIPVKDFANPDENAHIINGGFEPEFFAGAGYMMVNPTSDEEGWVAYDDLYVCNVEAPAFLKAENTTDVKTELTWEPSASDIIGYRVYRNGEMIVETTDTSYVDSSLVPGENYSYAVYAVDKYGAMSVPSNYVDIYTSSVGAPLNFKAESSFADVLKAHLSWEIPAYGMPIGYEVYRDGEMIGETEADVMEYDDIDEDMQEDSFHTYYVKAKSESDISMASESKYILVTYIGYPDGVTVDASGSDIKVSWGNIESAREYRVYRNGEAIATVPAGTSEYTDTKWNYSTAYTYYVRSVSATGRESGDSKRITTIMYPQDQKSDMIFEDRTTSDYYINSVGSSATETVDTEYALGNKSARVTVSSGSFNAEGLAFVASSKLDLTQRRANGSRLEFFVYAEDTELLENVMVGFGCDSDLLGGKKYTARCGVNISDYVTQYGFWNYVSIPLSVFPISGTYAESISSSRLQTMKYSEIKEIDFYSSTPHYLADKSFYIDDVKFADFSQPTIQKVTTYDGTEIISGAVIPTTTKALNFTFDSNIDAESLAGNISLKSADSLFSTDCSAINNVITVNMPSAIQKQTAYMVEFNGIKSVSGAVVNNAAFDFSTDNTDSDNKTEMSDTEYVTFDSVNVTRGKNANIRLALSSDNAKSAPISALDVTVKYDADILGVISKDSVSLAGSLKDAASVTVDNNSGVINIKIEKGATSYTIGSYIADIAFIAKRAGSSDIAVSGTLTQAAPEKNVAIAQKSAASVVVTTYNEGSSSGSSGGGSFGGGRGEATAKGETFVPTTDSNNTNNASKRMFSDSAEVLWAEKAIESLGADGKINGYEDGTFKPLRTVTREEFVAMIVRALSQTDETAVSDLSDVDESAWYAPAVATAQKLGITEGRGGAFGVGEAITRQDMCTMLARAAEACKISLRNAYATTIFADSDSIADYAKDCVSALQRAGIVNGTDGNMFAPADVVNRAMAAKVIYMLMQLK